MNDKTEPLSTVAVGPLVSHCQKCGDQLTGHEDDGKALCRWCITGWEPENSSSNMVYDEKGQLVHG